MQTKWTSDVEQVERGFYKIYIIHQSTECTGEDGGGLVMMACVTQSVSQGLLYLHRKH